MSPESIVEYARRYLENAIITGELAPGQRIKEEEIASRLEISRPPIRQAFEGLVAEGLVTRNPRRGVFVSKITEADIYEIYTLKASLYELATSLAIDKMTDEGIAKLKNVVQMMENCTREEPINVTEYQTLAEEFSVNVLFDINGHRRLRKLLRSLNNQSKRLSYQNFMNREHLLSNYESHKLLLDAIIKKDKALAGRLCRARIVKGMKLLLQRAGKERLQK